MLTPQDYLAKVMEQIQSDVFDISTIDSRKALEENLRLNDMSNTLYTATHLDYDNFLIERRKFMAVKIKNYYEKL